jgi:hypothetical protein
MHTFQITIRSGTGGTWPVVAEERGPLRPLVTTPGVLRLDVPALDGCGDEEYGVALGRALFAGEIGTAFSDARARITDRLHVLLEVEDEGLATLRWEQLCGWIDRGWRVLALDQRVPFSRHLSSRNDRVYPDIERSDLKMLILAASPPGLEQYRLEPFDEARAVEAVKSGLGGQIPADVLATFPGADGLPTLDALCARLAGGGYRLLHVVCHGAFLAGPGETALYLADSEKGVAAVPGARLIERLRVTGGLPHLVFLSSCDSAAPAAEGALGALAHRMVRELGTPAVVAMSGRISVETARALSGAFYPRLRGHGEVDRALVEAFAGLADRPDVRVPVLFSRLGGRALFATEAPDAAGGFREAVPSFAAGPQNSPTPAPPAPVVTLPPAAQARAVDRAALVRTVSQLSPSDLARLVMLVEGAASHVSRQGTVPEQAAELIRWAESSTGPGLAVLREALDSFR